MKKLYLLLLLPFVAFADSDPDCVGNPHHCVNTGEGSSVVIADATAGADASAESSSDSSASSDSNSAATGGSVNSQNYYRGLALEFPELGDCFGGVQGGANSGIDGGFLGLNFINDSCWLQKLSDAETDLEIIARLKCGDSKFRNALVFDLPRKERRQGCIDYYKERKQAEIDAAREKLCNLRGECTYIKGVLEYRVVED